MGIASLAGPFLLTWFCIHVFLFLLQRFLNRPNLPVPGGSDTYELLPTSSSATASSSKVATTASHGMLVKPFNVRFTTTGLNDLFYKWGSHPKLARFWRISYDLGVLFAMLAMVAGWALLVYAAIGLIITTASQLLAAWAWFTGSSVNTGSEGGGQGMSASGMLQGLRKRDLSEGLTAQSATSGHGVERSGQDSDDPNMVLVPVIPGVTLPLSHLPYYLLALFLSGIVHEAGHAFAAARERIRTSSSGIFLYIIYPGAFVDLPSRAMSILTPIQQLRIICAGVWHNIVLFVLAWLILSSQLLQFSFRILGWQPLDDAVTVAEVSKDSPLYGHLAVGSIITQVDDVPLKGDPLGIWNKTLLDPENSHENDEGFCVPEAMLNAHPHDCCWFTPDNPFGHSPDKSLSCFIPMSKATIDDLDPDPNRILVKEGQCLPSIDVLASKEARRCSLSATPSDSGSSAACPAAHRCYRPFHAHTTAAMVRLYCRPAPWITDKGVLCNHLKDPGAEDVDEEEEDEEDESATTPRAPSHIVLYQGDPRDIWEGIQVTNMKTRWSFLPLGLPNATLLTLQYLMSFSLALSVLNIVPARHLDGHHALKSFWHLGRMLRISYKNSGSVAQTVRECLLVDVASVSVADSAGPTTSSLSGSSSSGTNSADGSSQSNSSASAALAASLSLSTAVSNNSKKAPLLIKSIVITSSMLLGGVMFGSLLQMIIQLYI